jgi:hypothetical protein
MSINIILSVGDMNNNININGQVNVQDKEAGQS